MSRSIGDIVFWGGRGHAKVLREIVEHLGYRLVAVFDNDAQLKSPFRDVPLYSGRQGFAEWRHGADRSRPVACLVAIGGAHGDTRVALQRFLESEGLTPIVAVHPRAYVAACARAAKGSQVLAHATICVEVRIGEACIVNTGSILDHESVLADGVHIGPGARLAGCVTVGEGTFIGTGATVLPRVRIGRNVIIGAGAVVTRDIPDDCVAYGVPARVVRANVPVTGSPV